MGALPPCVKKPKPFPAKEAPTINLDVRLTQESAIRRVKVAIRILLSQYAFVNGEHVSGIITWQPNEPLSRD